ncbi:RING-H2 finger protein ATL80 [Apostasia shenzhenica]|uniref:RING-H2 finger protein ATL80 n=1 Tax=Apostasia shenzhenica TaxID=1088818 RepID=A0A2I0B295_9ASPA|nr:RING-H2 finger protein ATL80 [Apostasia shenzhenica]
MASSPQPTIPSPPRPFQPSAAPSAAPSANNPNRLDYYYFVVGLALVAVVLLVTNAVAIGCCSWFRRFLAARGLVSGGPLSGDQVQRWIPAHKYRRKEQQDDGECAVCLSPFADGDEVRQLPQCRHSFHAACIDKWLRSHSSCPVCRSGVLPTPSHSVEIVACSGLHSQENLIGAGGAVVASV